MGDTDMEGNEVVRYMLKESNTSIKALAAMLEWDYQLLRNKLYKNNFSFNEIQRIADVLGFDLKAEKRRE